MQPWYCYWGYWGILYILIGHIIRYTYNPRKKENAPSLSSTILFIRVYITYWSLPTSSEGQTQTRSNSLQGQIHSKVKAFMFRDIFEKPSSSDLQASINTINVYVHDSTMRKRLVTSMAFMQGWLWKRPSLPKEYGSLTYCRFTKLYLSKPQKFQKISIGVMTKVEMSGHYALHHDKKQTYCYTHLMSTVRHDGEGEMI